MLFTRLIAIAQREDDIKQYLAYELTTVPMSLFDKAGMMRKPNKPALRDVFLKSASVADPSAMCVVDRGALLHRVRWPKQCSFKELTKCYVKFVHEHYFRSCIVFDGYDDGPSTKDHEHQRRDSRRRRLDHHQQK